MYIIKEENVFMKNFRRGILVVLGVFILGLPCFAQASEEKKDMEQYLEDGETIAVLYNNQNGLPTSEANAIAQTEDGFIWIGGYSGLVRYDGNEFYHFDATTGITSVGSLFVDSKERLWIGTNDKGVALYRDGEFEFFGKKEGLRSCAIKGIAEDKNGNIILATTQGMYYIDSEKKLNVLADKHIYRQYIHELQEDKEGNIYGVTLQGDVFLIQDLKVVSYLHNEDIGHGMITSVCAEGTNEGYVWLGTEESEVFLYDLKGKQDLAQSISTNEQNNINRICMVNENSLWLCSDNGVGYVDSNRQYIPVEQLPLNNSIDDMIEDYEGNLWFVSSRQGVMKITRNQFMNVSKRAGLGEMVVNTTCLYDNMLYIGTDSGLCILDENYSRVENDLTEQLKNVRIRCIKKDSKNNLWLCTYGDQGLICVHNDKSITNFNMSNGLNSDRVRTVLELENGNIAVTSSGGVNIIREGEIIRSYGEKEGITNTEILSICEGEMGVLYAGSDGAGIFEIKGNTVNCIGQDAGLDSEVILRIVKDPTDRGVWWVVTGNSIGFLKNGKVTLVRSFPYSNNLDLLFDGEQNMWILSGNGIYVVERSRMIEDEITDYTFYDASMGLPWNITANARNEVTEDGTVYLCGSSGVSSINLNGEEETVKGVKACVPFIQVDDKIYYFKDGDTITIPKESKRVTVYGYVLSYSLNNPEIIYYLKGFDEKANITKRSELKPISYTNLSGGEYTFYMKALKCGNDGKNEAKVKIIKEKRLSEQTWFGPLMMLLGFLVILGITRVYVQKRTEKYKKKNEENRIFVNQMIRAFSKAIDGKDKYTNGHSSRVAHYAKSIAESMGYSDEEVEDIYNIALLHDVGKIAIPDDILNKPDRLNDEEFSVMRQHAQYGYDILKEIEVFPDISLGARYHHERLDGKGYPLGLKEEQIPMIAKIIAVADTFDAMNSTRPYRKQMAMEDITAEMKRVSGTQLDAKIVEVLMQLIEAGKL